jgi:2-dehydro-3-deoxyglucarate aldolase
MLRENWVKGKLAAGEATVGSWITIAHPTVGEVMAQAGFDWLAIDMEHGIVGIESVQTLIQAMSGTPVVPLVRVPWNDQVIIKQVLETGAMGLVIPLVRSAEEARAAVAASRYPTAGIRGIGCQRPAGFGAWFQEYLQKANSSIMIVVQIEHIAALDRLEEILSVEGVDAILIGSNDLSASMGLLGQPTHPDVQEVVNTIRETAKRTGVPSGIIAATPADANKRITEGYQFIGIGHDVGLLSSVCRDICSAIEWK